MTVDAKEAVDRARQALGFGASARSWLVRRLSPLHGAYYLVAIGEVGGVTGLAAVDVESGEITNKVSLPGVDEHLAVNDVQARHLAHANPQAPAEPGLDPSQLSRSALYPFWIVTMLDDTRVYVDQSGTVHQRLSVSGRGGGGPAPA